MGRWQITVYPKMGNGTPYDTTIEADSYITAQKIAKEQFAGSRVAIWREERPIRFQKSRSTSVSSRDGRSSGRHSSPDLELDDEDYSSSRRHRRYNSEIDDNDDGLSSGGSSSGSLSSGRSSSGGSSATDRFVSAMSEDTSTSIIRALIRAASLCSPYLKHAPLAIAVLFVLLGNDVNLFYIADFNGIQALMFLILVPSIIMFLAAHSLLARLIIVTLISLTMLISAVAMGGSFLAVPVILLITAPVVMYYVRSPWAQMNFDRKAFVWRDKLG